MRLAVLPLALILVAATPVTAQIVINGSRQASASQRERPVPIVRGGGYRQDLRRIDRRTRRARANGEISRCEARAIRREASAIRSAGASYAASGLSDSELNVLESRTFALRDASQAPAGPTASACRSR